MAPSSLPVLVSSEAQINNNLPWQETDFGHDLTKDVQRLRENAQFYLDAAAAIYAH